MKCRKAVSPNLIWASLGFCVLFRHKSCGLFYSLIYGKPSSTGFCNYRSTGGLLSEWTLLFEQLTPPSTATLSSQIPRGQCHAWSCPPPSSVSSPPRPAWRCQRGRNPAPTMSPSRSFYAYKQVRAPAINLPTSGFIRNNERTTPWINQFAITTPLHIMRRQL